MDVGWGDTAAITGVMVGPGMGIGTVCTRYVQRTVSDSTAGN